MLHKKKQFVKLVFVRTFLYEGRMATQLRPLDQQAEAYLLQRETSRLVLLTKSALEVGQLSGELTPSVSMPTVLQLLCAGQYAGTLSIEWETGGAEAATYHRAYLHLIPGTIADAHIVGVARAPEKCLYRLLVLERGRFHFESGEPISPTLPEKSYHAWALAASHESDLCRLYPRSPAAWLSRGSGLSTQEDEPILAFVRNGSTFQTLLDRMPLLDSVIHRQVHLLEASGSLRSTATS